MEEPVKLAMETSPVPRYVDQCKDFSFYSEWDEKPLEQFEQKNDDKVFCFNSIFGCYIKIDWRETSLVVQWLRLGFQSRDVGDSDSIPGQRTKIPHAA